MRRIGLTKKRKQVPGEKKHNRRLELDRKNGKLRSSPYGVKEERESKKAVEREVKEGR